VKRNEPKQQKLGGGRKENRGEQKRKKKKKRRGSRERPERNITERGGTFGGGRGEKGE
jgi:hypothetical protein